MCEQTNTGASDLRKRYWQEHGKPPEGQGPHPDHGPAYIPWLEALVTRLEANQVPQIDFSSWFYRNCVTNRRREAKICQVCPFRTHIEQQEALGGE